ncbi:hypothetical protein BJ138DRAFT_1017205, partial [Hygrophoropsis aurantiaca]
MEEHGHKQTCCTGFVSIFKCVRRSRSKKGCSANVDSTQRSSFPPKPPSQDLCKKIIHNFCEDSLPDRLEEGGCAVCGRLTRV